jgi:simple sugar transport system permease protein
LVVLAAGLWLAGYPPGAALGALWQGAFGSWHAVTSATLVRAVPLIILGLGFALAMRAGALNIGAEGQFLVGAVAATWAGQVVAGWPAFLAIPFVLGCALAAGALWVAVPVLLRVRFGVLEVITTLLLNFVAEQVVSWMVTGPLQESARTYPQSDPIAAAAQLPMVPGTRLHLGLLLGCVIAGVLWFLLRRTLWGFRLRAVGAGARAAEVSGRVNSRRILAVALLWSGAIAGLGGGVEITGVTRALFMNLSPGYGFTAIAVALLARLHPVGIVATGVLFGALQAGAGAMQREAGVPAVAVFVVQAWVVVVMAVVAVRRSEKGEVRREKGEGRSEKKGTGNGEQGTGAIGLAQGEVRG